MLAFFARRLAGAVCTLLLVCLLTVLLLDLTPGDAAQAAVGETASAAQIARVRQEMGLDRSPLHRFAAYVGQAALHGDLGRSLTSGRPVAALVGERLGATARLAGAAVALALALGLAAGGLAAARQGSALDVGLMALAALGIATPGFWLALLLMLVFCVELGWLPVVATGGGWKALLLPAACLGLPAAAAVARLARASLLDASRCDYARAAYARGMTRRRVWLAHILPNSLIPVLTMVGLHLAHLLSGAFIIETIFSYPGLGRLVVQAIFERDFPVVSGAVLVIAGLTVTVNFAVDAAHRLLDPRVRAHG